MNRSVLGPAPLATTGLGALRQAGRVVLAAFAFVGFGLLGGVLSWLVLPPLCCDPNRERRERRCQRVVQATFLVFHAYLRACRLVDFDPRRLERTLPNGPLVLVPNHPTLVDVTALIAAYGPLYVAVKSSLFRNPLFAPLLRCSGHIRVRESGFGGGAESALHEVLERLRRGQRVLMFPEGTRSPRVGLGRFHAGAFHAALRTGASVLPLAISAQPEGLKSGQAWYDIPTTAIKLRITRLPLRAAEAYADAYALQVDTRKQIETALATRSGA